MDDVELSTTQNSYWSPLYPTNRSRCSPTCVVAVFAALSTQRLQLPSCLDCQAVVEEGTQVDVDSFGGRLHCHIQHVYLGYLNHVSAAPNPSRANG